MSFGQFDFDQKMQSRIFIAGIFGRFQAGLLYGSLFAD
jgi:hypothetical protein